MDPEHTPRDAARGIVVGCYRSTGFEEEEFEARRLREESLDRDPLQQSP